jgi:oligosaccharide repeat unit polymerase
MIASGSLVAMLQPPDDQLHFPALYFPLVLALVCLLVETWIKRRQPWALPAAFLYVTIFAWYFADLTITPESYSALPSSLLNISYCQVAEFLVVYRLATPWLTRKCVRNAKKLPALRRPLGPEKLFVATIIFWLVLLAIAVTMMGGGLVGALFPVGARTANTMWTRGGAGSAGATGFLVSTGGYLYLLVCASFGVWLLFLKRLSMQLLAVALIFLAWPSFLLSGTRSIFLGVCMPFFFAYLLFGRHAIWIRIVYLAVAFVVVDIAMRTVITYRNIGFEGLVATERGEENPETLSSNQGLNMIEELCYENVFISSHSPAYGTRYLQELGNVIPRAIWPSKPLLGIDYAIWRGFGGADNDLGVNATISSGMIGGGVLNFGPWLGAIAPALLLAAWTGLLARWWLQRASLLRCFLYLAGLGLTFNLGRDITLLVLWPIVFGYLIVRLVEYLTASKSSSSRRRPPATRRHVIVPAEAIAVAETDKKNR